VCLDGTGAGRRRALAAVVVLSCSRSSRRAAAGRDSAREARDADGRASPPMTRIRRILETALHCDDLSRSAAINRMLVDVTLMIDAEGLFVMEAGEGTLLLLFQRGNADPLPPPGGVIPGHTAGGPGHFAFAIDAADLAGWEQRLIGLGIAIESR